MHQLFVCNTSNQVCHNSIRIIHTLLWVSTIVLQLLYIILNLSLNQNVCYFIIAFKFYNYVKSCIHTTGTTTPWQFIIRQYALLKATRNLLIADFCTLSIDNSSITT